ncbi:MAG: copper resistance protein CopZ [Alphaproteobacteria bacterium HGW-Alphaproteobacteria-5]|nr:MAG: copper resistance protein CopZ [Alphaproteobacteria bacterium HGW-Alphaproteobacteria-5]
MKPAVLALAILITLSACREEVADLPPPVTMSAAAVGHYCQMNILEHPGPKAQVHLAGLAQPLFFSQVRDAIAYQRLPEQSGLIRAIYVNDMGVAPNWEDTGADNWIDATKAFFVVGSARMGGMGAPELVPFAESGAAAGFAAQNGGEVLRLAAIPDEDVLTPVELTPGTSDAEEQDYRERLRALSNETGG